MAVGRKQAVDMTAPWREMAACRGEPTELWFPARGLKTFVIERVCVECPVVAECQDFGWGERHGIWGGLRLSDRRAADTTECPVCGDDLPAGRWRWCSATCQTAASAAPGQSTQLPLPITTREPLVGPVGAAVRSERLSRGLTTRAAADRCGVTEARYVGWEEGRVQVEVEQIVAVARFLQTTVPVAALVAGVELPEPESAPSTAAGVSPKQLRLPF